MQVFVIIYNTLVEEFKTLLATAVTFSNDAAILLVEREKHKITKLQNRNRSKGTQPFVPEINIVTFVFSCFA